MPLTSEQVDRLETLHNKGYVHRDLKPDNFVIGMGRCDHIIHLIDFGFAEPFADFVTGEHRPYSDGRELLGTVRYVSLNAHKGIVQTRRDDLISLCYILIYFARGSLPWQGIRGPELGKNEQAARVKGNVKPEHLCQGLPKVFSLLLKYATNLGFEERPDYNYVHTIIRQRLSEEDWDSQLRFDWERSPAERDGRV